MKYLNWDEKIVTDFSDKKISDFYDRGYVFTRIGKGIMQQTRSVRIDLAKFTPSSENRRILKKVESIQMSAEALPMKNYKFSTAKMAKDFYENKFGDGIMSAAKVKEILTDPTKSNFNQLLKYGDNLGFSICYVNNEMVHYSYPFYSLKESPADMGLGMMTKAIVWAKESGKKYIYLGSLQRPSDTYKLQFSGLEWFDKDRGWQSDVEEVKQILKSSSAN